MGSRKSLGAAHDFDPGKWTVISIGKVELLPTLIFGTEGVTEVSGNGTRERIFKFVSEFYTKNGWAPSYREICSAVGLKSISTVSHHITALKAKGLLSASYHGPRSIVVQNGVPVDVDDVQRVRLMFADGGSLSFDCSFQKGDQGELRFVASGVVDISRAKKKSSTIVQCCIDNEEV